MLRLVVVWNRYGWYHSDMWWYVVWYGTHIIIIIIIIMDDAVPYHTNYCNKRLV